MSSPLQFTRVSPTRLLSYRMFNRAVKGLHRARLDSADCNLHSVVADQMVERRAFVKRDTPVVLEIGSHSGWYLRHMLQKKQLFGLKQYIQTDISEDRLNKNYKEVRAMLPPGVELVQMCCDEEQPNPFDLPDHTIDMAVSVLALHWVNDLEGTMVSIRRVLKRDGFLLMSMFGGNTLYELRSAFALAEKECEGGLSPHVSPMVDGAGISGLLLQSGFNLPSIDMDRHLLQYASPFHVMEHIQRMGEGAVHHMRRPNVPRSTLVAMAAIYERMYAKHNLTPATFEVFHAIGWSPSPDQAAPLPRGSQQLSLSSLSSARHKELQGMLNDMAAHPDDPQLAQRAEDLFVRLREEMEEEQRGRGVDPLAAVHPATPVAQDGRPAPPNAGEEGETARPYTPAKTAAPIPSPDAEAMAEAARLARPGGAGGAAALPGVPPLVSGSGGFAKKVSTEGPQPQGLEWMHQYTGFSGRGSPGAGSGGLPDVGGGGGQPRP